MLVSRTAVCRFTATIVVCAVLFGASTASAGDVAPPTVVKYGNCTYAIVLNVPSWGYIKASALTNCSRRMLNEFWIYGIDRDRTPHKVTYAYRKKLNTLYAPGFIADFKSSWHHWGRLGTSWHACIAVERIVCTPLWYSPG